MTDGAMPTQARVANMVRTRVAMTLCRRLVLNASAGIVGLSTASLLIAPKVIALAAGDLAVLGTGAAANLALLFGSLMFLREARRARAISHAQADVEPQLTP